MKAILVAKNKELLWKDVANPTVKNDEVLVKVAYAAVNRADLMQRDGDYPPPKGCPEWMGLEVSGEIIEIGNSKETIEKWKIGDKVCCLFGGDGYAEYVAVKYDMCMPVPENCSMAEAAAIPEAFATAYLKLFIEGKAKKGETLLMNAGASGLASVVIPMAKAFGLRVITTVIKNPDKIAHLYANLVVNTKEQSIVEVLKKEESEGRGVDIAIDCLGGEVLGECLPYVNYACRWIVIASLAGDYTTINLKNIFKKNIRIIGSTLRSRTPEMKAYILSELVKNVWDKISSGEIKPTIYKVLPITEAEQAHDLLKNGVSVGKVVLKVN